jgi:hypothetical protein
MSSTRSTISTNTIIEVDRPHRIPEKDLFRRTGTLTHCLTLIRTSHPKHLILISSSVRTAYQLYFWMRIR